MPGPGNAKVSLARAGGQDRGPLSCLLFVSENRGQHGRGQSCPWPCFESTYVGAEDSTFTRMYVQMGDRLGLKR